MADTQADSESKAKSTWQMPSTFPAMFLTMLVLAIVCGLALGQVHTATAEPIAANLLAKQIEALTAVLPHFDNDPIVESVTVANDPGLRIYPASLGGQSVGTGVLTYSDQGFGGRITVIVGIDPTGHILDLKVVELSETPGLGTKITSENFTTQFRGLSSRDNHRLAVRRDGGEIDAISAATISSRALVDAVNKAMAAERAYAQGVNL